MLYLLKAIIKRMITPILILIIVLLLGLGAGIVAWFVFRQKQPVKETTPKESMPFRWTYIILPLAFFLLTAVLAAFFYPQFPAEVAYNFKLDGSPDRLVSREMLIVWILVPQVIFTLLATAITWGTTRIGSRFKQQQSPPIRLERVLSLMGNMVALPQVILCFALVDIFSYNSFQTHIMPLWVFALIIALVGAIVLGIFFVSIIRRLQGSA